MVIIVVFDDSQVDVAGKESPSTMAIFVKINVKQN